MRGPSSVAGLVVIQSSYPCTAFPPTPTHPPTHPLLPLLQTFPPGRSDRPKGVMLLQLTTYNSLPGSGPAALSLPPPPIRLPLLPRRRVSFPPLPPSAGLLFASSAVSFSLRSAWGPET